jgi:hypothetical protein
MRLNLILFLGIALAPPQLSPAEIPVPEQSLGQLESMLDFCAKANPESAPKLKEVKKALAGDASEKELTEARESKGYKDGYKLASDQLEKIPREKAAKACSAYLEPSN